MTTPNPTAALFSGAPGLLLSVRLDVTSGPMRPCCDRRAITCCDHGRLRIDPHLRGHVTPRTLAALRRADLSVLQVGQAALIRANGAAWVVGVWDKERPAFADRLDRHHRWLIGRDA